MTFLHISLLLGAIAAAAPIAMHLLGRRQPKQISFPAVRFVRETAIVAQRGWSVKRWLLLALRVLLLLVLALALAAPRVVIGLFGDVALGGLLAILAVIASAATFLAWGGKKPWPLIAIAGAIAAVLWGASAMFFASTVNNGEPLALVNTGGPVCAAIIVDTSPSMGYRYHNTTRLDDAKEMARWLMDRFPVPSQIAIVGGDGGVRLNPDRLSAERQLERVAVEGKAANLADRISSAIEVLRKSELERREIYVLTDMRDKGWENAGSADLVQKLSAKDAAGDPQPKVLLQLIDLSVPEEEIKKWSISNVRLSQESAIPGGQISVTADIVANREASEEQLMCELAVETVDRKLPMVRDGKMVVPESKLVERQLVQVPKGETVTIQMVIRNLVEGTNHAVLRLSRPDPLEMDNVSYLTIEAQQQGQVAVIADDSRDGQLVSLMLDPGRGVGIEPGNGAGKGSSNEGSSTSAPVVPTTAVVEPTSRISNMDLAKYGHMVLFNPRSLSADDADRLLAWVDGGGGLLMVLGPAAQSAEAIESNGLASLVPGKIKRMSRRDWDDRSMVLSPVIENHPIWSVFERPIREIPWVNYPVFRHWDLENLAPGASEIMKFTGSELPAIVEWVRGQGRILVMTFPYPEPNSTATTQPWSELFTTSSDAWPGFALFLGATRYLATHNKHPVNYTIDATALLDNNTTQYPKVYELFHPGGDVVRVESADELISYSFTRQPGQYRLRGVRPRGPVVRGFSVNVDRDEISLERTPSGKLDEVLGKNGYLIAKTKEQVQSSIGEGRYGKDLTPFLLVIVTMMVMAEQTMSSRFYASTSRGKS